MQLLIDTETESPEGLLMAAQVLMLIAKGELHELQAIGDSVRIAPVPADVPAGTGDPAVLFAKGGAPSPLAPAPTAAIAPAAATSTAPPTLALVIAPPPAPAVVTAAAPDAVNSSPPVTPLTSATAAPPVNVAVERDSAGYPWDVRVHSETRKLNADGTWRYRRNLDAHVKAAVMADLKAHLPGAQVSLPAVGGGGTTVMGHIAPPPPPPLVVIAPPPPAATTDVAPPPPVTPQPPVNAVAPPAPVQLPVQTNVGMPVPGNAGTLPAVTSFRDLMLKVNQALAAGRITQAQLAEACKAAGADGVTALAAQPMLVPTVDAYLNRWLV